MAINKTKNKEPGERKKWDATTDKKRANEPQLNRIRNVPSDVISKLDDLAEELGSKKIATIKAIEFLHEEMFK